MSAGNVIFDIISVCAMLSPPFLLFFAWRGQLDMSATQPLPRWRAIAAWVALLSISVLLVACVVAFLTIPCNVDLGDWSCVARWRTFTRFVIRCSPFMILLALLGRKRMRIFAALTVLAIDFDCLQVDMMA